MVRFKIVGVTQRKSRSKDLLFSLAPFVDLRSTTLIKVAFRPLVEKRFYFILNKIFS